MEMMNEITRELKEIKSLLVAKVNKPLTTAEAADYMGINTEVLRRKLRGGEITHYKVGTSYYILKEDIDNYLLSNKVLGYIDARKEASTIMNKKKR